MKQIIIELIQPNHELKTETLQGESVGTRNDDKTFPGFVVFYADHTTRYIPIEYLFAFTMVLPPKN
jgi:hypothetical protein